MKYCEKVTVMSGQILVNIVCEFHTPQLCTKVVPPDLLQKTNCTSWWVDNIKNYTYLDSVKNRQCLVGLLHLLVTNIPY